MIELITGLPGAGKTLWTLQRVETLRKETGRPVYYHNITELTLPWTRLLNGDDWVTAPDKAIIVLDECQMTFPTRPQGSKAPAHVEAVSVHRHRGLDLFLITQDAYQFDAFVRRLVGRHHHFKRAFGLGFARVWSWEGLGKPGDYFSERDAVKSRWKHAADFFNVYKSAEVHTKTSSMPWKKIATVTAGLLLVVGLIWSVVNRWGARGEPDPVVASSGSLTVAKPDRIPGGSVRWDAESWEERVSGIKASSPVFDRAVQVVAAPVVAGCMEVRIDKAVLCRCSTPQGTDAGVDDRSCQKYVREGVFRWDRVASDYYPVVPAHVIGASSAAAQDVAEPSSRPMVQSGRMPGADPSADGGALGGGR